MDADTLELLQDVSREVAAGLARLVPDTGPNLQVLQSGPVVLLVPVAQESSRPGRREYIEPKGFYAS